MDIDVDGYRCRVGVRVGVWVRVDVGRYRFGCRWI